MMFESATFFSNKYEELYLFESLNTFVRFNFSNITMRVTKSQIAYSSKHPFLYVWLPIRPIRNRPKHYLIVSFMSNRQIEHPRIVEAVQPYPERWMHHSILSETTQLDPLLLAWIQESYQFANHTKTSSLSK